MSTKTRRRFFTVEYARIKIRAAAKGKTIAQIAEDCGVTRQALDMQLKGGCPNLDRQIQLAESLGTSLEKVLAPLTNAELISAALWYAGLKEEQR